MVDWNAIVLAGGRASRLGGIDKTALVFHGRTLLERSISAVTGATSSAVVVDESPRFGGPAAATIAGLDSLSRPRARWTAVIAADLPHIEKALPMLLAALDTAPFTGGVIAVDDDGRRQPLLAIYRTSALALAGEELRGSLANLGMLRLIAPIHLTEVPLPSALCADIDTAEAAHAHGITLPGVLVGV